MMIARPRTAAAVALATVALVLGGVPREASPHGDDDNRNGNDSLALRVNDATGVPGGLVAVVVRTYASRPIRRGQVCLRATSAGASSPLSALEGTAVFSPQGDATSSSSFRDQRAILSFSSPSGTINTSDGPMAVLYFRLGQNVREGERYDLVLDPGQTSLVDGEGRTLSVDPRPGRLEIKGRGTSFELAAVGGRIRPGRVAALGIETSEPGAVARGRVALRWDPRFAAGLPQVRMDPRYGNAIFRVARLGPGQVVVRFVSLDASLNRVPGRFLEILLPTSRQARPGDRTALTIDPKLTFLEGPGGVRLPLEIENGVLSFR